MLEHAIIVGNISKSFNETVEVECIAGYRLVGSSKVACGDNGNWVTENITCEGKTCFFKRKSELIPSMCISYFLYSFYSANHAGEYKI